MKSRLFPPENNALRNELFGGQRFSPEFQTHLDQLQRFRALLDHANDIILLVRLDSRRIVDANASACRQLRYPCEMLVGLPVEIVVDFEGLQWPEEVGEGIECRTIVTELQRREGGRLPVEILLCMEEFGDASYVVIVARDVTERKRAEEALERSRKQFRDLVETINDWVWEVDMNGVYTYASPRVRDLLGYEPEEVVGKTPFDLMPESEAAGVAMFFRERMEKKEAFSALENTNRHRDGRLVVLETSGTPFFDEEWNLLGYRGVDRDVTVRKQAEHALRESDRMKTDFISTAAHELRTPLTSILGFSQVLLGPENLSEAEQKEFLTYIHQQAESLSGLVADLLDIARIESGQGLALRREFCTPGELVTQLAPFIQSGRERSRFELAITSETAPLLVDKAKMAQVFENLLSNAVKYSPPGSPIRIAGEISGENYRFTVADRGFGMTAKQVARVFDKFYRADASDTAVGGLGLGMSIVRNIVEAHGGSIWVESEPGRGTTAYFHLPLGRPETSGKGIPGEEDPDR